MKIIKMRLLAAYDPLELDGDFSVQIDVTDINTNTPVNLPRACDNPISR